MAPLLDDGDQDWIYQPQTDKLLCLLPRKCRTSGESLWLTKAWRVRFHDWSGHEDRWYCEREYLWMKLKET